VCIYFSDTYAHYIAFGLFCAGDFGKDAFPLSPVMRHGLFEKGQQKKSKKKALVYLLYWYQSTNTDTVSRQVALTSCAAALRACDAKRVALTY
jgi:hypothetical protein